MASRRNLPAADLLVIDDNQVKAAARAGARAARAHHVEASVMFSDIRSFTNITEALSPATIELLNSSYKLMFDEIGGHGGIFNQMSQAALVYSVPSRTAAMSGCHSTECVRPVGHTLGRQPVISAG